MRPGFLCFGIEKVIGLHGSCGIQIDCVCVGSRPHAARVPGKTHQRITEDIP
jgi:hypothetical protein